MKFAELAALRRSNREFENRRVDRETIERILSVTFSAPSSKNSKTTRIAVIEDRETLRIISEMRNFGSAFLKDAPLAFIVMGDEAQSDLWRENAAISATVLQFAAEDEGLVSCWVHVNGRLRDNDDPSGPTASEYLHEKFPSLLGFGILCVVAVGYPVKDKKARELKADESKIVEI